MQTYPINLVGLEDRRCIVVGGGKVAERKVAGLIAAGARPVVISPALQEGLDDMLKAGLIEHVPRGYMPGDLAGAFLVIAAAGDAMVNHQVGVAATHERILVNVVDCPHLCNYYTPAVVRRGDLVVSISSGGNAPALASQLRREIERSIGEEYEIMVDWCASIRPLMRERFPNPDERKARWYALVNSPVLPLISAGKYDQARKWIEENLGTRLADLLMTVLQKETNG